MYRFATFTEPATPATDRAWVFLDDADNTMKVKYDDGTVVPWGGGSGGGELSPNATVGSPNVITAAGGISILGDQREVQFIKSNGGSVTVTANPQIVAGTILGQELILFGTDATDKVRLSNGTGLRLNGNCILSSGSSLYLVWNGSVWAEVSRNDL
jgi:hypothetical protein